MEMIACTILILLLCLAEIKPSQDWWGQRFQEYGTVWKIPEHIINLMLVSYKSSAQRITDSNGMRFKYEETPEYEIGYLMSEIMERYKVTTMQMKRLWRSDTALYDSVDCVERILRYYFEIYHIANMMYEIPLKYHKIYEEYNSAEQEKIENIEADIKYIMVKEEYDRLKAKKFKTLKSKKREMRDKNRQVIMGNIPPQYDPSDPRYDPSNGAKYLYKIAANVTEKSPISHKQKQVSPNSNEKYDYGWDLPSDWDFKK